MFLHRHLFHKLVLKGHSRLDAVQRWQEAVIVAFPSTEASAFRIECHTRDYRKSDLSGRYCNRIGGWFQNAPVPFDHMHWRILPQFQDISHNLREDYPLSAIPPADESVRIHLTRHGPVQKNNI